MAITIWNVKLKSFQASLVQGIKCSLGASQRTSLRNCFANISEFIDYS